MHIRPTIQIGNFKIRHLLLHKFKHAKDHNKIKMGHDSKPIAIASNPNKVWLYLFLLKYTYVRGQLSSCEKIVDLTLMAGINKLFSSILTFCK